LDIKIYVGCLNGSPKKNHKLNDELLGAFLLLYIYYYKL